MKNNTICPYETSSGGGGRKKSINRVRRLVVIQGNLSAPTKQVTLQDYVQQKWQSMRNAKL